MSTHLARFSGKIVLVTGSARGIGYEISRAFAQEGATLVLNDVDPKQLQKSLEEIMKISPDSTSYHCDVSSSIQVSQMIDKIVLQLGRIDILVNNAGIGTPTSFLDLSEEEWDKVMGVNLKGAFLVTQRVMRQMVRQKYGRVVMISSLAGKMGGVATGIHYSISKGGLIVMARQVAREFGSQNITVNAVAPSFAETDLLKDLRLEGKKEELAKLNVIQRLAMPSDIANAVLFLASDESSFITGETINVNGGRYMD